MGLSKSAAFGLALAMASMSAAADPAVQKGPDWLRKPTSESLLGVWPAGAIEKGIGGRAVIACKVNVRGVLHSCTVLSEHPAGSGFGGAALALTPQFLMRPAMKDGVPVEAEVRIPINFPAWPSRPGSIADTPMTRKMLSNPQWSAAPTLDDVAKVYPDKARGARVGGLVTFTCTFNKTAALRYCTVLREEPRGYGFGGAARELLPKFTGPAALRDGKPISGVGVQVQFSFAPQMLDGVVEASRLQLAEMPDHAALLARYPQSAMKAGVLTARVVLACKAVEAGRLEACRVESEEPKGYDIGAATLPLGSSFRVSLWSDDGLPTVGANVRLPIRYKIEDAPPKP